MLTLVTFLKKVNDPRKNLGKRHPLWLILLLVVLGTMFGHLGYRDIAAFGKAHQQLIVKFFQISGDRIPSYSTIRRAMMLVDTSNLVEVFNQWARSLSPTNSKGDWVSIDGKCLKSTCDEPNTNNQNYVSIVSLFSQTTGLVLRLQNFESKKSSEIKWVQELVKAEASREQVFTLDALHCQKETTTLITQGKNDYTIALKGNQKKLLQAAKKISESRHHQKAVTNLSILTTIALNLYRWLGFRSVKAGQRWLGARLDHLILIAA